MIQSKLIKKTITLYLKQNESIPPNKAKFLDITFTGTLSWSEHILELKKTINRNLLLKKRMLLYKSRNSKNYLFLKLS